MQHPDAVANVVTGTITVLADSEDTDILHHDDGRILGLSATVSPWGEDETAMDRADEALAEMGWQRTGDWSPDDGECWTAPVAPAQGEEPLYVAENPRDTLAAAGLLDTGDPDRADEQIAEYGRRYREAAARVAPHAEVLVSEDAPALDAHHRRNDPDAVEDDRVRLVWQSIHDAVEWPEQ